jgi:hypothetical protein
LKPLKIARIVFAARFAAFNTPLAQTQMKSFETHTKRFNHQRLKTHNRGRTPPPARWTA